MNYIKVYKSNFLRRPNRFVVEIELDSKEVKAHLPNPGRMWELLFPGVVMYVIYSGGNGKKTDYRVVGIERDGVPIMLDTNHSNDVAALLIEEKRIPGWEDWNVLKREVTMGKSRFDLLLGKGEERFFLEVKSCTLFSRRGAMFPDAVTERGRKHLLHLAHLQKEGYRTGVLFLVQWERAEWFLPDYHTDLAFAQTFYEVAPSLDWKAIAVRWTEEFDKPEYVRELSYAPYVLEREAHDRGDYLAIIHVTEEREITIGAKGKMIFPPAYYVYVGSAKANLEKRMERHKRLRKQKHWHIDYLRAAGDVIAVLPIRTADDLEHSLAQTMQGIATFYMAEFGCTDCDCPSHLFAFTENPIHYEPFMNAVEKYRMNRLDCYME